MIKKFDDLTVKNLKQGDKPYYCMAEGEKGFGVRVYPSGVKVFVFRYKVDGVQKLLNLGEYTKSGSLKVARDEYVKASSKVRDLRNGKADGADPVKEIKLQAERRIQEQADQDAAVTIKTLAEDYIKKYAEANKKSWLEDKRILEKEIYPAWGKRKAQDITKRDVTLLLEKIVDRGAPSTANNTFKIIRKMFNWSIKKSILEMSPCDRLDMPAPMNQKDRALDAAEIKTLWVALEDKTTSMRPAVRLALKLILITAQRPGEVSGMNTEEIVGNWWNIPAERTKNGRAHSVYLTGLAKDCIDKAIAEVKRIREIPPEMKYSGYIFPCPHHKKNKPMERHALSRALKRNESDDQKTTMGIATFTPHDLRRSANTLMAASKVIKEHRERVLNHTLEKLDATYNLHDYDDEKQIALESLERKLKSIIFGAANNVIPITAGKKAA